MYWTAYSAWSLIAWTLLGCLAWLMRLRLKHIGASGPRLWIWPLAILCFGVVGAVLCWLTERNRAYLPAVQDMGAGCEEPLLKSA